MKDLVFKGENGKALTNSLLVAEKFGKRHKDVLESIRKLMATAENPAVLGMFVKSQYVTEQNKTLPMIVMNRDGFTLLAMGFTGGKAMQFKVDYIAAFNKMEEALKAQATPTTQLEILAQSVQALLEQSKRIDKVENRLDEMEKEREENGILLLQATVSHEVLPQMSMRDNIRQLVNRYAIATNTAQRDVWHKVYDQLYYLYKIHINGYKKHGRETNLDVAERNHFLDKIYNIISNLVREVEPKRK